MGRSSPSTTGRRGRPCSFMRAQASSTQSRSRHATTCRVMIASTPVMQLLPAQELIWPTMSVLASTPTILPCESQTTTSSTCGFDISAAAARTGESHRIVARRSRAFPIICDTSIPASLPAETSIVTTVDGATGAVMSHPSIRVERRGSIAQVTLDRPDKHNCLSTGMWQEIDRLFSELDADESLRCIVLSGAGGKAFSVGADIAEFPEVRRDAGQARRYAKLVNGALTAVGTCRHPVVAAIHG